MSVMALEGLGSTGADVFAAGGEGSSSEALSARSQRTTRAATQRRNTVLGSSASGGSNGGESKTKEDRKPLHEAGGLGRKGLGSTRTSGGKSKGFSFDSLAGKTGGGALLAEYAGGAIIIILGTLTRGPSQGYNNVMAELMLRLTALTTVFFTLLLLSGTKGGKAAVWFGLLVDLGILFTAATENVLAQTAQIIQGTPIGGDVLTASTSVTEPPSSITLPSDQPTTGTTAATTSAATATTATATA